MHKLLTLFFKAILLSQLLLFSSISFGYSLKLPSPKAGLFDFSKDPCQSLIQINPKQLPWPYPGTPPWYAEPETKVYNDTIVTGFVDSLKSVSVPGLPDTFEDVFKVFQDAGCLLYIHGGCVRDFLLGLSPKDIDIEYSCSPDVLKKVCIKAYGKDKCHFSDDNSYFYVGKVEPSSQFEELEGANWNGTIFQGNVIL